MIRQYIYYRDASLKIQSSTCKLIEHKNTTGESRQLVV